MSRSILNTAEHRLDSLQDWHEQTGSVPSMVSFNMVQSRLCEAKKTRQEIQVALHKALVACESWHLDNLKDGSWHRADSKGMLQTVKNSERKTLERWQENNEASASRNQNWNAMSP